MGCVCIGTNPYFVKIIDLHNILCFVIVAISSESGCCCATPG